tara:strand:- start:5295 stop:6134 length:840 start_codon:yes stop_codon:yes gene_type:complete
MSYFKQFPKTTFDFLKDGKKQAMVDIHKSVRPVQHFLDDITEYSFYQIQDGERPDIVSQRLYSTSDYYWSFFVVNDFLADGYITWPLSINDLELDIDRTYSGQTIVTRPALELDSFGKVTRYIDNINANGPIDPTSFIVGEYVVDDVTTPTTVGQITQINVDLNQIIIAPVGDSGGFSDNSQLTGRSSGKTIRAEKVYKTREAPFYYYATNDGTKRPAGCPAFFTNDTSVIGSDDILTMPFVSNQAFAISRNDDRSRIRVISPKYIEQFAIEYFKLINQ